MHHSGIFYPLSSLLLFTWWTAHKLYGEYESKTDRQIIAESLKDHFDPDKWPEEVRIVLGDVDRGAYRERGRRLSEVVIKGGALGGVDQDLEKESPFFIQIVGAYLGVNQVPTIPPLGDAKTKWEMGQSHLDGILPMNIGERDLQQSTRLFEVTQSICNKWITIGSEEIGRWLSSQDGAWHNANLLNILQTVSETSLIQKAASVADVERVLKIIARASKVTEENLNFDVYGFRPFIIQEASFVASKMEGESTQCQQAAGSARIALLVSLLKKHNSDLADLILRDPLVNESVVESEELKKSAVLFLDRISDQVKGSVKKNKENLPELILAALRRRFHENPHLENSVILFREVSERFKMEHCCGGS